MNKYFNRLYHSDIDPYELVKVVSEKCVIIKAMKATLVNGNKMNFHVGGFMAHCSNQNEQEWNIESRDDAKGFRIRLHKDGTWHDSGGSRYKPDTKPMKFYDYNF